MLIYFFALITTASHAVRNYYCRCLLSGVLDNVAKTINKRDKKDKTKTA